MLVPGKEKNVVSELWGRDCGGRVGIEGATYDRTVQGLKEMQPQIHLREGGGVGGVWVGPVVDRRCYCSGE